MSERLLKNIVITVAGFFLLIFFLNFLVTIVDVKGYEVAVVHKWIGGVQDQPLGNGTHFVFMGRVHKMNIGTQKMTFATPGTTTDAKAAKNAKASADDIEALGEYPRIEVSCGKEGGQKTWITLTINYNLDPSHAVQVYKDGVADTYGYVVLKRTAIDVVNRVARPKEAMDIFSGEGFNRLKEEVEQQMKDHPMLAERGIIVQNATIYDVDLDPPYEAEIAAKQLAKQFKLTQIEQRLASEEEAKKTAASAQVMVETRRAEAEAKKIEVVKKAEADKEQVVLKAEADKMQVVLAAEAGKEKLRNQGEGEKMQQIAQADGQYALGMAQAKVETAKRNAMYEGPAGERRARVEIATAQASLLKGVLYGVKVIPDKSFMALVEENAKLPPIVVPEAADGGK